MARYSTLASRYHLRLVAGTSVELEGMLVKSLGKGQALELQVSKMKVVGSCDGEVKKIQSQLAPVPNKKGKFSFQNHPRFPYVRHTLFKRNAIRSSS